RRGHAEPHPLSTDAGRRRTSVRTDVDRPRTRQDQRSTPTLKSKIGRGYRAVITIITSATMVSSANATHSTTSTSRWGIASSHLTSHSPRLSGSSRRASTRTGYAAGGGPTGGGRSGGGAPVPPGGVPVPPGGVLVRSSIPSPVPTP